MNVKLLLDENLSPWVAETLRREDGLDAVHVRDRGLLRTPDHVVLERAFREDRVLVTCNVDDFLKLARARELHPGIVLLEEGDLPRAEQLTVVRQVVAFLHPQADIANGVVTVYADGRMLFEEIPPPA